MRPLKQKNQPLDETSPTKSVMFFSTGSPDQNCVSCWNSANKATGRWEDKGGGWLACPDCCGAQQSCFTCVYCKEVTPPGNDIECRLHGVKSPFLVCEQHVKR